MSTIKKVTTNYSLRIPVFDAPGWGREMERNFEIVDSVMFLLSNFGSVKGLWLNGTAYISGDRVIDPSDGKLFQALEDHTSAATGTFAQDRASHPTYWKLTSNTVQNRGDWVTGTTYNVNDFIVHDHKYGVVVTGYTSGVSYDADVLAGNIVTLIDLTDDYNDVTNAALYISTMETAINALYNIRTDITAVGAIDTDIASVAAIASDVTTVANNTSNISTVVTNIADVQSVATNMSDIQAAQQHAADAEDARDFAYLWSSAAEDATVDDGVNPAGNSAFHFMKKTEAAASAVLAGVANLIHEASSKATPVDADELALVDSANSWSLKKLTWANVKAALTSEFLPLDGSAAMKGDLDLGGKRLIRAAWLDKALFEPFPLLIDPDIDVALMPPKLRGANDAIYVMLTANKAGAGQYNEGLLINQSVSGSGALVQATAEIDLPGSPKHGATIHLINTERRFLRAGETGGGPEQDAMQRITGTAATGDNHGLIRPTGIVSGAFYKAGTTRPTAITGAPNAGSSDLGFDSDGSPGARVSDDETRVKNLSAVYFMRIA